MVRRWSGVDSGDELLAVPYGGSAAKKWPTIYKK